MKQLLPFFTFFFFPFLIYSQTSPFEFKIIATHRSGMSDTLYLGIDTAGGYGFQKGLDIIDTNFNPPIAIGAYDSVIMQDSNFTHPAFLRKDVLSFRDSNQLVAIKTDTSKYVINGVWVWNFAFYVGSDSMGFNVPFFGSPGDPIDSLPPHLIITWDTTGLNFFSGKYRLYNIGIFIEGGYFDIWDGDGACIYDMQLGCGGYWDDDSLFVMYEQSSGSWWWYANSCRNFNLCQILGFEVSIWLWDTTETIYGYWVVGENEIIKRTEIKLYPNPVSNILHISSPFFIYGDIEIYNNIGILVHTEKVQPSIVQSLNLSFLPCGSYILKYTDKNTNSKIYKIFIKQ